jgi:cytidylate kinase
MRQNSPFVITISRQLGSGGAYIGQQLARKLNIFYADREIIKQAAKQFSLVEETLQTRDERLSSFWQVFVQSYALGAPDTYILPPVIIPTDRELFNVESEIIKHIAREQSSVIIGRCGSYILREHPTHLSLFLHADIKFRKARIQNLYNISDKEAEKMIVQSDKERALYNRTFAGKEWTDARQYDLTIDTGKTGIEKSIEIIMKRLGD